jgi:hypothetical protein
VRWSAYDSCLVTQECNDAKPAIVRLATELASAGTQAKVGMIDCSQNIADKAGGQSWCEALGATVLPVQGALSLVQIVAWAVRMALQL